MTRKEAEEIFDRNVKEYTHDSEYAGIVPQSRNLQLDGYFTLKEIEGIVRLYREYLENVKDQEEV